MDKLQEISDKINDLMDDYINEVERIKKPDEIIAGAVMVKVKDCGVWLISVVRVLK